MRGGNVGDVEFRPIRQPAGERVSARAAEACEPSRAFAHAPAIVAPGPSDLALMGTQCGVIRPSCRGGLEGLRDGSCAGRGAHATLRRRLDLPTQDLAGGSFRERFLEPHETGVLVCGDPRLDEALDLLGIRLVAGLEDDRGADVLAELVVGQAHDRGLHDVGVLVEHLLDLARVDVEAAADDHLLLAVDDEEIAVVVDPGQIAGVKPPVGIDRLCGRLVGCSSTPSSRCDRGS